MYSSTILITPYIGQQMANISCKRMLFQNFSKVQNWRPNALKALFMHKSATFSLLSGVLSTILLNKNNLQLFKGLF